MLPNNPSQDKFLLAPLNKLHYSSSSVSGGRSDNPPWKCSCWQMCAWLSRITAAIRKTKLYPLVATIQWSSSVLLLYGTWSWTGHNVPAVIPWPCTSNLCSVLMWTFFFFFFLLVCNKSKCCVNCSWCLHAGNWIVVRLWLTCWSVDDDVRWLLKV